MSLKLTPPLFVFVFLLLHATTCTAYGDTDVDDSVAINLPSECTYTRLYDLVGVISCENILPDFSASNKTLLANALSLTIDHCTSTVITRQHLKFFGKLDELKIIDCDEIELEDDAFDDLTELRDITIESVAITFPGDLFCQLNSLRSLTIKNNRISSDDSLGFGNCSTTGVQSLSCATTFSNLEVSNSLLTSIKKDGFLCNIKSLFDLDLKDNAIASIEKEAFVAVPQLHRLTLRRNQIKELPIDTFEFATSLRTLDLSNNQLSQLSIDVFKPLTKLFTLDLSENFIATLSPGLFNSLIQLTYLNLSNNQIQNVDNAFKNLNKLFHIDLNSNRLETIDAHTLDGLQSTTTFHFKNNTIKTIVANIFDMCLSLYHLDLSYNRLKEFPLLKKTESIGTLLLDHNEIDELRAFDFNFTNLLRTLSLSYNKMSALGPKAFAQFPNLNDLDLSYNIIETVDNSALDGLADLRQLNLSGNQISFQNNNFLNSNEQQQPSPMTIIFTAVKNLRILDLSNNNISDLSNFQLPSIIYGLLLNDNKIKSIHPEAFKNLTQLEILNLRNNSLTTLPKLQLLNPSTKIMLRDNPFLCDCALSWLNDREMGMSSTFHPQSMTCSVDFNPEFKVGLGASASSYQILTLKTAFVQELKQNFLCATTFQNKTNQSSTAKCSSRNCIQQQQQLCPERCICYHNLQRTIVKMVCANSSTMVQIPRDIPVATDAAIFYNLSITSIDVDSFQSYTNVTHLAIRNTRLNYIHENAFKPMINLETIDLSNNKLTVLEQPIFKRLLQLKHVDLSFNKLNSIGLHVFDYLTSLESLNIANNQLTNFPAWSIDSLANVSSIALGGNPWSCDCSFLIPFKEFLISHSGSVVNASQLYCKRERLSDEVILLRMFNVSHCTRNNYFLSDFDSMEYENSSNVAIIVLGFLFSFVVIVLGIFVFMFRVELKIGIARRIRRSLL